MNANALVLEAPESLAMREIEVPEVGPREILIRVELSGICGTDVHMYDGGIDLDFPVIPGHEFAGFIEEIGEERKHDSKGEEISEGDAVTVVPGIVCDECWYCNNVPTRPQACKNREIYGYFNVDEPPYAHGGFSEYLVIREKATFYKLPDGLDVELGALAEPLSVATHAFERSYAPGIPSAREGFGVGKSVAVQGAGPIGLLTIAAANLAGADTIIAIDPVDDRLELAKRFGANECISPDAHVDEDSLTRAVKDLTNGNVGPDVVIEAAGVPIALAQAIDFVRDGGTVVEVGHFAYNGEVEINPAQIVQKDINIAGSLVYPPNQFETSLSLLSQLEDEVPFKDLFNFRVSFDAAEEAYAKQASGEAYRATIHPGK